MAVKKPILFLLCGPKSAAKSALVDSFSEKYGVEILSIEAVNARRGYAENDPRIDSAVMEASLEVLIFEIITAGMSGQSLAINDVAGDQDVLDRYRANAMGSGMQIEIRSA
jgi:hypothetical protein